MPKIDMICLANSRKLQGRCVAGLRTDGEGWIRPVAAVPLGTLHPGHYMLQDVTQPLLMDVISVSYHGGQAEPHQPENWLIDSTGWRLVFRPAPAEYDAILRGSLETGPGLLGNESNRVDYATLAAMPGAASLALVVPEDLQWNVTTDFRGQRRTKARFKLAGAAYDLPITDPCWPSRLDHLPLGVYPVAAANVAADEYVMLTVSLGEPTPWDNCCYKVVAGVVVAKR